MHQISTGSAARAASARWAFAVLVAATSCVGDQPGLTSPTTLDADSAVRSSIASVTIDPANVSVAVGDSGMYTAVVKDTRGRVTTRAITWSSSDSTIVRVQSNGFARAVGVGSAQIRATSGGIVGVSQATVVGDSVAQPPTPVVATVTVSPGSASGAVGDSAQFTATARDANGNEVTGQTVAWSSTNAAVVVVSAGGMGRGVGAGSATIVATINGVTGSSAVTVTGSAITPPPSPAAVASVTIAPTSVSVNVLGTAQLAATLRDASGNVLTGRTITWSSSNGLVAGVSSNGMVTGLAGGTATITASSEGVTGSASASVTLLPPPPPPPTGGWPNMPSTYSILTDQAFNPLTLPGWDLIWNPVGNGSITNNSTAPFSASSVFEAKYPAGFAGGTAPATQTYGLGGKRNVYVGMWWKANANWQGHGSNVNKLQFLFPVGGGDLYMTAYGPPGGPFELRINLQFSGADTRGWLRPNAANGIVTMGNWHRIEWLVEYNTPGSANGVIKWWLDGQLVGDYRDVTFPGTGLEEYKLSPTWGGVGETKAQTDYFWFDHIVISSK